jgi:uncharacterized SAM-binding protein YcdF (DUF218 family)
LIAAEAYGNSQLGRLPHLAFSSYLSQAMPILLDKLLPLFIYPVGLAILASVAGFVLSLTGFARTSRAVLGAAIAVLWTSSTPLFADWLYSELESEHPPVAIQALPPSDVAIVLGGGVGHPLPPRLTSDANETVDRALHGARIFHAGKVEAILVSGGNLPWQTASDSEAELIADLLGELGVPHSAIVLETKSRNTRENAVNIATIMNAKNWQRALLVTSAAHMPRAVAAFEKADVEVVPASTDVRVTYPLIGSVLDFLPSVGALALTTDAIKELLGMVVYRIRGWI